MSYTLSRRFPGLDFEEVTDSLSRRVILFSRRASRKCHCCYNKKIQPGNTIDIKRPKKEREHIYIYKVGNSNNIKSRPMWRLSGRNEHESDSEKNMYLTILIWILYPTITIIILLIDQQTYKIGEQWDPKQNFDCLMWDRCGLISF